MSHHEEEIAELLRVLPPAPAAWVAAAQRLDSRAAVEARREAVLRALRVDPDRVRDR